MKKKLSILLTISLLLLLSVTTILLYPRDQESVQGLVIKPFETEPTVTIDPELTMARFSPYIISAEGIPETPSSVSLEIWGKNGNSSEEICWDYYVDGTCGSENITKSMTYDGTSWKSPNIYPDSIYPEIYFANSNLTWVRKSFICFAFFSIVNSLQWPASSMLWW